MELIITLCAALSAGTVFGVVAGAAKYRLHRKRSYSDKQVAAYQRLWKKGSILLRFATGTVLAMVPRSRPPRAGACSGRGVLTPPIRPRRRPGL